MALRCIALVACLFLVALINGQTVTFFTENTCTTADPSTYGNINTIAMQATAFDGKTCTVYESGSVLTFCAQSATFTNFNSSYFQDVPDCSGAATITISSPLNAVAQTTPDCTANAVTILGTAPGTPYALVNCGSKGTAPFPIIPMPDAPAVEIFQDSACSKPDYIFPVLDSTSLFDTTGDCVLNPATPMNSYKIIITSNVFFYQMFNGTSCDSSALYFQVVNVATITSTTACISAAYSIPSQPTVNLQAYIIVNYPGTPTPPTPTPPYFIIYDDDQCSSASSSGAISLPETSGKCMPNSTTMSSGTALCTPSSLVISSYNNTDCSGTPINVFKTTATVTSTTSCTPALNSEAGHPDLNVYVTVNCPGSDDDGTALWVYIVGGVVAFIVLAAIIGCVVFFLRRPRSGKAAEPYRPMLGDTKQQGYGASGYGSQM